VPDVTVEKMRPVWLYEPALTWAKRAKKATRAKSCDKNFIVVELCVFGRKGGGGVIISNK
jgi:hypothetical protein